MRTVILSQSVLQSGSVPLIDFMYAPLKFCMHLCLRYKRHIISNDSVTLVLCEGVDDLVSDAELDVVGIDEAIYGSLAAPRLKVVQRCP